MFSNTITIHNIKPAAIQEYTSIIWLLISNKAGGFRGFFREIHWIIWGSLKAFIVRNISTIVTWSLGKSCYNKTKNLRKTIITLFLIHNNYNNPASKLLLQLIAKIDLYSYTKEHPCMLCVPTPSRFLFSNVYK